MWRYSYINDYGIGMLSALGVKFFDNDGQEMKKIVAKDITKIKNFDISKSIVNDIKKNCKIIVSCNLTSPKISEVFLRAYLHHPIDF